MSTSEDNAATEIANRVYEPSGAPDASIGPPGYSRRGIVLRSPRGAVPLVTLVFLELVAGGNIYSLLRKTACGPA